jgi:hypothetical protein
VYASANTQLFKDALNVSWGWYAGHIQFKMWTDSNLPSIKGQPLRIMLQPHIWRRWQRDWSVTIISSHPLAKWWPTDISNTTVLFLYATTSGVFRILQRGPRAGSLRDGSPPVRSRGEAPVGGLGDFVPQKLKDFRKFIHKILMPDDSRCVKLHECNTN